MKRRSTVERGTLLNPRNSHRTRTSSQISAPRAAKAITKIQPNKKWRQMSVSGERLSTNGKELICSRIVVKWSIRKACSEVNLRGAIPRAKLGLSLKIKFHVLQ